MTPEEKREIQHLALIDGCNQSEIARRTGRDRSTVAIVLRSDDTRKIAEQLESEQCEQARSLLRRNSLVAATKWVRAIDNAAEKGDHRPAKDLLLHTDVIQPIADDR